MKSLVIKNLYNYSHYGAYVTEPKQIAHIININQQDDYNICDIEVGQKHRLKHKTTMFYGYDDDMKKLFGKEGTIRRIDSDGEIYFEECEFHEDGFCFHVYDLEN